MRRLPFFRHLPAVEPLSAQDAAALHILHEQSLPHAWDEAAFQKFLTDAQIIGFGARKRGESENLSGFILARIIGDEAEILTFAVAPKARRRGIGKALLEHLLRFLYRERVRTVFLEADEYNAPALALYRGLNFKETGRRKAYYAPAPAPKSAEKARQAADCRPRRSDALLFEYKYK